MLHIQWNLAIPATLGTNESGWISEVAGFQGTLLMYEDGSIIWCLKVWL